MDLPNQYLYISDATTHMAALGYNNVEAVRYGIRRNLFRVGVEVVDARSPGSIRPTYKINPHLCGLRLKESPARRNPRGKGRPPNTTRFTKALHSEV